MTGKAAERHGLPSAAPYRGQTAVLATMHGKEVAIAPVLEARLELGVLLPIGIDTDSLGTFSGEIPRAGTIEAAAIAKARLGMKLAGNSLGIASEGSYGPHPQIPFVAAGIELMVLVDDDRHITIREHLIDDKPVYDHAIVADFDQLLPFLHRMSFPSHAVIVRPNEIEPDHGPIFKDLDNPSELKARLAACAAASSDGMAFAQTDMRAHKNPTRMAALGRLAERFADRVARICPVCRSPGFGLVRTKKGLPCCDCGCPTGFVRVMVSGCVACVFEQESGRPDGLHCTDPGQCPNCNP